jgi:hypothetical protein
MHLRVAGPLKECSDTPTVTHDSSGWPVFLCFYSLNNLRDGLLQDSFVNFKFQTLRLSSCNLRPYSLIPGMLASINPTSAISALYLDNMDRSMMSARNQMLNQTANLFSAAFFNPPTENYALCSPTTEEYLNSWSNFFDPCQFSEHEFQFHLKSKNAVALFECVTQCCMVFLLRWICWFC